MCGENQMDDDFYNSESERTSHKVIEKRRRDRINNCLMELSQTVPSVFAKQSSGKLEKAEILEMTVEYLRTIQRTESGLKHDTRIMQGGNTWSEFCQHFQLGYNECMREVVHYMTDIEGLGINDSRCVRIVSYLQTRLIPNITLNNTDFPHPERESKPEYKGKVTDIPLGRSFRRYTPYRSNQIGHLTTGPFVNKPSCVIPTSMNLRSPPHNGSFNFL